MNERCCGVENSVYAIIKVAPDSCLSFLKAITLARILPNHDTLHPARPEIVILNHCDLGAFVCLIYDTEVDIKGLASGSEVRNEARIFELKVLQNKLIITRDCSFNFVKVKVVGLIEAGEPKISIVRVVKDTSNVFISQECVLRVIAIRLPI